MIRPVSAVPIRRAGAPAPVRRRGEDRRAAIGVRADAGADSVEGRLSAPLWPDRAGREDPGGAAPARTVTPAVLAALLALRHGG